MTELTEVLPVNGVDLAWGQWGEGRSEIPLVLCHGFSGSGFDFALNIPELVAAGHWVIALDHRGHGRSTKTRDVASYTIQQLAADFNAALDALVGDRQIDLLGHSMGGIVAQLVTLARPERVRSLILMDTTAWSVTTDPDHEAVMTALIEEFDPAGPLPDPSQLPASPEAGLVEASTPAEWQAVKAELMSEFDPFAVKGLGMQLIARRDFSLRERLPAITCPVTVLAGENDHPFVDQAPELAALLPRAGVVIIPGAFHSPQLTHREQWRAAVEDHLASV